MADLSAYQALNVALNYVTNQIILTDPDNYPVGVSASLVGKITVLQPDGVQIAGDFTDIVYSSGALQPHSQALRLNSVGNPQCGDYVITYEIDHPDYTPTTITKTFTLSYTRKTLDLEEDFDVFTPSLFYRDNTNFAQAGWTLNSNTVAWQADFGIGAGMGTPVTLNGSADDFDLVHLGNYYDSEYAITYQRDVSYSHPTYTFLTLVDRYSDSIATTADTPPTVNDIIHCLNDQKAALDAAQVCTPCGPLECEYQKATARYDHLIHKLRIGDADDAEDLLEEILNITHCAHDVDRGAVISPYDLSAYTGGGGTSLFYNYTLSADVTEVTLVALNGAVISNIWMDGILRQFSSGADGDTPATGKFIVVTGSAPRKFKYGGTMFTDQWLRIEYTV